MTHQTHKNLTFPAHELPNVHSNNMPVYVASSELIVTDLTGMVAWYQTAIGLNIISQTEVSVALGVGGRTLLTLTENRDAMIAPVNEPGLYHNAFLVPNRKALANWLAHAIHANVKLNGASDHLVSEALYLDDPEGNGIEIYHDRNRSDWKFQSDGTVEMGILRMDVAQLLAEGDAKDWKGMAEGTTLGHIHLKVSTTAAADAFFVNVLGMDLMLADGAAHFFASGQYHHHVGANTWHSSGRSRNSKPLTGLKRYDLIFNDEKMFDRVKKYIEYSTLDTHWQEERLFVTDPWGMTATLSRYGRAFGIRPSA